MFLFKQHIQRNKPTVRHARTKMFLLIINFSQHIFNNFDGIFGTLTSRWNPSIIGNSTFFLLIISDYILNTLYTPCDSHTDYNQLRS